MAATGIAMGAGTSEQQELKTWASGRGGRLPRSATSTALGLSAAGRTGMGKHVRERGYNHQKSPFLEAAYVLVSLELTLLPRLSP